jgi:hypothetical protein
MIRGQAVRGGWGGTRRAEGEDDRQQDSRRPDHKQKMGRTKKKQLQKKRGKKVHTPIAKYNVSAIDPKYAAVNGSRGPETKCLA